MAVQPVADPSMCRAGPLLDHLARRMRLRSESVLAPLGLRPRHLVALTVLRELGGCSQRGLAGTLEMDGTNVVGLLNELEAERLIERRRSPQDRRRHVVELTDAGARRLAEAECALAAVEDEVLGALDRAQREMLYHLLRQAVGGASCGEPVGGARGNDCTAAAHSCTVGQGLPAAGCTEDDPGRPRS